MTTIAAIATAIVPQQGSIGIIRLSGSEAIPIAQRLFHAPGNQPWESHRVLYGQVRDPGDDRLVDEALLLVMKGPRSYTREDVVEFHCHGGIIVVQQVLQLCLGQGARLAQPGEFTLRAFLNGRIDLTQAEGITELVGAQSAQAAQAALAGVQGKLAAPIRSLRSACLDLLAEVEARIDFEEDLPPLDLGLVRSQLAQILAEVRSLLATAERGALLRSGLRVAIVGQPNVGKSSLLNAWSRSDRAIVTDLPGTTRDVVESQLVVGGIPVQVLDTAGIRASDDRVEQLGVDRSRRAASQADLVLLVISAIEGWTAADRRILEEILGADGARQSRPWRLVINKCDLVDVAMLDASVRRDLAADGVVWVEPIVHTAAAQHQGLEDLEAAILAAVGVAVGASTPGQGQGLIAGNLDIAINQRQAAALLRAEQSLAQVEATIAAQLPLDFWTIDLRSALQALDEIIGEGLTEAILDRIFSRFCIGK
jgi:tRNA modification GTPase